MSNLSSNFKKGDLVVYSGYLGKLYPSIFWGTGQGTLQFTPLNYWSLKCIKEGKKPGINYIYGSNLYERVVKIQPTELEAEKLEWYNKIKNYIDGGRDNS
jgi:hypothetical protein